MKMFSKKEDELKPCLIPWKTKCTGELQVDGPVTIEGEVLNVVSTGDLLVFGKVLGYADGKNVHVSGEVKGNIASENVVHLRGTAKVTGDIKCRSLVIEEGAIFSGYVTIVNLDGEISEIAE